MELPQRKRIRLKDYDYRQNGVYFITICTADRKPLLWRSVGADIIRPHKPTLSQFGEIVKTAIEQIPSHYENAAIDKYTIMPNHIHLVLFISSDKSGRILSAPTLSRIVGSMKRWVSKQMGISIWQKFFHDHIIRNEREYQKIWEYIDTNPLRWEEDCFFTQ